MSLNAIAQIGCRGSNGITYTSIAGMIGNYRNSGGMMTTAPAPPSGCIYSPLPSPNGCTFTDGTTGVLVSTTTLECPIDESYFFFGFGILISIISVRKLNSNKPMLSEI